MLKRSFLLITALLLLSGCKTLLTQQDSEKSLLETLKAYEATMRWGYPGQTYNFLRKDLAEKTEIPSTLQNIRITGYKVISAPVISNENLASQVVVIGYVFDDRQVEHSLTDRQLWEYGKEKKTWHRINSIPDLR